jgi:hypothetical protein
VLIELLLGRGADAPKQYKKSIDLLGLARSSGGLRSRRGRGIGR